MRCPLSCHPGGKAGREPQTGPHPLPQPLPSCVPIYPWRSCSTLSREGESAARGTGQAREGPCVNLEKDPQTGVCSVDVFGEEACGRPELKSWPEGGQVRKGKWRGEEAEDGENGDEESSRPAWRG